MVTSRKPGSPNILDAVLDNVFWHGYRLLRTFLEAECVSKIERATVSVTVVDNRPTLQRVEAYDKEGQLLKTIADPSVFQALLKDPAYRVASDIDAWALIVFYLAHTGGVWTRNDFWAPVIIYTLDMLGPASRP